MMHSEYDICVCNQIKGNKSNATTEITMIWADVADNSQNVTRAFEQVKADACTCHVFQHNRDDGRVTIQQLYGGGKSKCARTKDGRFVQSKKKSTNKEESEHGDEKSKSNQSDKNETDCRPDHDNVNRQNSCSNQVPTMNADQDFKTGNLVCDKDKGN